MVTNQQLIEESLQGLIRQQSAAAEPGANGVSVCCKGEERRRHPRLTTPEMEVILDGKPHLTLNWSMGGMVLEGYEGRRATGALLTIERIRSLAGDMTPVRVHGRVLRNDVHSKRLVISLLHMDGAGHDLLMSFMEERVRRLRKLRSADAEASFAAPRVVAGTAV